MPWRAVAKPLGKMPYTTEPGNLPLQSIMMGEGYRNFNVPLRGGRLITARGVFSDTFELTAGLGADQQNALYSWMAQSVSSVNPTFQMYAVKSMRRRRGESGAECRVDFYHDPIRAPKVEGEVRAIVLSPRAPEDLMKGRRYALDGLKPFDGIDKERYEAALAWARRFSLMGFDAGKLDGECTKKVCVKPKFVGEREFKEFLAEKDQRLHVEKVVTGVRGRWSGGLDVTFENGHIRLEGTYKRYFSNEIRTMAEGLANRLLIEPDPTQLAIYQEFYRFERARAAAAAIGRGIATGLGYAAHGIVLGLGAMAAAAGPVSASASERWKSYKSRRAEARRLREDRETQERARAALEKEYMVLFLQERGVAPREFTPTDPLSTSYGFCVLQVEPACLRGKAIPLGPALKKKADEEVAAKVAEALRLAEEERRMLEQVQLPSLPAPATGPDEGPDSGY